MTSLCSLAKREIEVSSDVIFFVIHLFLLETGVSVCCEEESSTKSIRAFVNQLYKPSGSYQDYFLSRNKIKFRHSFVSAQVFGLPNSTGPLGFPNKVCDRQAICTYLKYMQQSYHQTNSKSLSCRGAVLFPTPGIGQIGLTIPQGFHSPNSTSFGPNNKTSSLLTYSSPSIWFFRIFKYIVVQPYFSIGRQTIHHFFYKTWSSGPNTKT